MSVEAQQPSSSSPPHPGPHFEDFSVGQRIATTLGGTDPAGHPVAPTAGPTAFLALAAEVGVLPGSVLRVLETRWRDVRPEAAHGTLETRFTVTACRRGAAGSAGSVLWHGQVLDDRGRTVQEGSIEALLPARPGSDGSTDPAERAFCSRPWGESLARLLADDETFGSATATWDGTIGLRAGRNQVQLRVYRGRIIEVAGRTPHGATFTLEADEHLWTELMTGPTNDFFRRAMSGESFTVTGNAYEYLRMSKALMALIDAARDLATGVRA